MLKIAICDDSPLFLEQAVIMIREWSTERQLPIELYSCENGDRLIDAHRILFFWTSSCPFSMAWMLHGKSGSRIEP